MENLHEAPQDTPQRLLLRVPEVAKALGLSRSTIYEMIAKGELPVVRAGRAVRVSTAAVEKWITEHESQDISA
jgi:excisionase family DNA binding protein